MLDIWIPISDLKIQLSDKDYPRIVGQYLTNNNKMVHTRLGYYYNIRIGDYIHTIIYPRQCGSDIKIGVFIEDKDNN